MNDIFILLLTGAFIGFVGGVITEKVRVIMKGNHEG